MWAGHSILGSLTIVSWAEDRSFVRSVCEKEEPRAEGQCQGLREPAAGVGLAPTTGVWSVGDWAAHIPIVLLEGAGGGYSWPPLLLALSLVYIWTASLPPGAGGDSIQEGHLVDAHSSHQGSMKILQRAQGL